MRHRESRYSPGCLNRKLGTSSSKLEFLPPRRTASTFARDGEFLSAAYASDAPVASDEISAARNLLCLRQL